MVQRVGSSLSLQFFCSLIQFVCVESLVTALVDMYPRVFRKKNRRELLILSVSVVSFFVGLVMLTEVRVWEAWRCGPGEEEKPSWTLPPVRRSRLCGFRSRGRPSGLQGPGTPSFPSHRKHKAGGSFLWPLDTGHLPLGVAKGSFGSR